MIDLAANEQAEGFIKRKLRQFGLATDIGTAVAFLASTIRDHVHFEQLLTGITGEERQMLYDSCVPHLKFTALPLDVYISRAGSRAEREQLPTLENGKLIPYKAASDVNSIIQKSLADKLLMLECSKCTRTEEFYGTDNETRVDVIMRARKAGWVYDYMAAVPCEICPKCPTSLRPNA